MFSAMLTVQLWNTLCKCRTSELLATVWFLKTVNKWFDLVASRRRVLALSLHDREQYRCEQEFLVEIIRLLDDMRNREEDTEASPDWRHSHDSLYTGLGRPSPHTGIWIGIDW